MKKYYSYLYACSYLAILAACEPKHNNQSPRAAEVDHPIVKSYKAPYFYNDDRVEKIKALGPQLQKIIEDHALANDIPGIAFGVVVDNELVLTASTGMINMDDQLPATAESSFRIASLTKSFTAMSILQLRDEGSLSLLDPVAKYIPDMEGLEYLTKDSPIVTIENLLTMTSGLPEDNPWGDRQLDESEEMLEDLVAQGLSMSNVPAYQFEYSNTSYALLGNIISQVSGMPCQTYIQENILRPLGMDQTYWEYDNIPKEKLALGYRREDGQWKAETLLHDGVFAPIGGLITSIEDFSKYVSFQLSAWPPRNDNDTGPLKRSSLREMQRPQFSRLKSNASDFNGLPCPAISGYGYGLGITEDCNNVRRISHGGALPGYGSDYVFFPEYGFGIMAFCNLTYTSPYPFRKIEKLLFDVIGTNSRKLPVSDILRQRQKQIVSLIQDWNPDIEAEILAENFYMDFSREHRISKIQDVLIKAGDILDTSILEPENQLRGKFKLEAKNGEITIFFTLTPENVPKIQQLDLSFMRHM
tara:strand:+ start:20025 stop:21611 length:1587 start_codon:yes stop_codon:yes gene_type:complete